MATQAIRVVPSADRREWIVVAEWFGQERTVYGPTNLYAACRERVRLEKET